MSHLRKVLLVAKEWRGGLANYVFHAFQQYSDIQIEWIRTHPVSIAERFVYKRDRKQWRGKLVEQIKTRRDDLVLFINPPGFLKSLEAKPGYIAWLTDNPLLNFENYAPYAGLYISDPGYADEMSALAGERFLGVMSFACDPNTHQAAVHTAYTGKCVFMANRDQKRTAWLDGLLQRSLPLTVYGNYFFNSKLFFQHPFVFRPSVPYSAMAQVYHHYDLSINIHADVVRGGTNMRTFECAALGVPQIVEWREGIEELFDPESEIITVRSADEMVQAMEAVLADHERLQHLAVQARQRVLAEHTYYHRVKQILDDFG